MESLAGMKWNPWPEWNGITGRNHLESVAGMPWNMQTIYSTSPAPWQPRHFAQLFPCVSSIEKKSLFLLLKNYCARVHFKYPIISEKLRLDR